MNRNESFGALAATDALGRLLPGEEQAGPVRKDRYVGVFYFLTHRRTNGRTGITNVTQLCRERPEAVRSFQDPAWAEGQAIYWGKPLFDYYSIDDPWVLRRHVKLLTMAGVDFLIFDTTNRVTFFPRVKALLEVLEAYRQEGWDVPKIVYYTNTRSGETAREIWEDLYKPGLYPELWFRWEGKPLIIADPDECSEEMRDFFTFRLPQWPTERKKQGAIPWIDFERPQRAWDGADGKPEVVPVSVSQHPNLSFGDGAFYGDPVPRGRGFHDHHNDKTPEALAYGYNVAEQWERAIELDPKIVFFTGWNEWYVGPIRGDGDRPVLLVDQANDEYSRDAEPMEGGFFDNYYMQLCACIRRFKGAPAQPGPMAVKTIRIGDGFDQWDDVGPALEAMPFGTLPRDWPGMDGQRKTEDTGRNELRVMRAAHDARNVYFYVECARDIVFNMFTQWMELYIRFEGRPYEPDWHGYHYLVNNIVLNGNCTFLQRCLGGYRWGDNTRVSYRMEGPRMMLALPKALLGLREDEGFVMRFKWADHCGTDETIEDFYLHGDCAPYGRFDWQLRAEPAGEP